MKKIISTVAFCAVSMTAVNVQAALNEAEILRKLEYLQRKVETQQQKLDAQQVTINELKEQTTLAPQGAVQPKVVLANSFIDQLKIKGDMRVRFEKRQLDNDDYDRDRWRTRFRVGGIWKNMTENWEIGAGVALGGYDATSTNETWGDDGVFETEDLRLDYAYARHKWDNFTFTAGQHKNPYKTSWILWDSDVRLMGFTGAYEPDMGFFATAGAYAARHNEKVNHNDNTAMLYMGQVGFKGKVGGAKYTVAAGYHTYDTTFINEQSDKTGDQLEYVDPNKYELNIGDIYGDIHFPLGTAKMKLYGHVWQNFGADGQKGESQVNYADIDPQDEDMGWVFGVQSKINKFKLKYYYSYIEADSLYGGLKDSDFGTGVNNTDIEGHTIGIAYNFSGNLSLGLTAMFYEAIEFKSNTKPEDGDLYQFDLKYKF